MIKMGGAGYQGIYNSDRKLKLWISYLNLLAQCCHEEFRHILSQSKEYDFLSKNSLEIWIKTMENHEGIFKGSEYKTLINDVLFYSMTLFSSSPYISLDMSRVYEEKKEVIWGLLEKKFKILGLKTLEVTLLLVLINSS
jgi:hypothetical protein